MGLDFKIGDFAYPLAILRLKRIFDKNQWMSIEELENYQFIRIQKILGQAYDHVPHYRDLFRQRGLTPKDIRTLQDLKRIPCLTKKEIQRACNFLLAEDYKKYNPKWVSTSGTTGGQVRLCMDKFSNALEFAYYWRFWGWAGYRLGDTFAEMSAQHFTPHEENSDRFYDFQPLIRRVMVNSLLLSQENVDGYVKLFRKFKPKFLKGLPSNLYALALLLKEKKEQGVAFKAVFSQGENLLKYQRDLIEATFSCKVYDFYGHMERTVTISECPKGNYHINMDYGLLEIEPVHNAEVAGGLLEDEYVGEVIGTGLYNFAMPLIRYRTGDWVKVKKNPTKCPCGRNFPTVVSILGRDSDIIVTPDGRMITALYVVFDRTPGILCGQIVQKEDGELIVKIVARRHGNEESLRRAIEAQIRSFVGKAMRLSIVFSKPEDFIGNGKFKGIISEAIFNAK